MLLQNLLKKQMIEGSKKELFIDKLGQVEMVYFVLTCLDKYMNKI